MRVFAAGVITETNTFAPWPTGLRGFSEEGPYHGDATTRGRESEMGVLASGWRDLCRERGFEFVESLFAFAQPSGRTVQSVYENFRDEILSDLTSKGPFDIVLLFLHGAMVSQACDDCEGDLLSRVREIVGTRVAVGAELDPHCHLTPLMVESATAIVLMKEYPHTDYLERGRELFDICAGTAQGRLKPVSHLFDCRMVGFYPTTTEPMRGLVEQMTGGGTAPGRALGQLRSRISVGRHAGNRIESPCHHRWRSASRWRRGDAKSGMRSMMSATPCFRDIRRWTRRLP